MDIGKIQLKRITDEIKEDYLDYAMSVIVARALPDVRDGLKPVQRRILYTMYEEGLTAQSKLKKSATVVGSCLGKYHPHGDMAVYDALVRMAQDFSLRYPLVQGQGNFGSIDGDPAAAQRYTECRLSKIGEEMLRDIHKETVNFRDNYDASRQEPTVLPSPLPQLLLNGSMGIAVGMATKIPPHNLREVIEATIYLVDHSEATVDDLMQFIKGPDFPTGGVIYNRKAILQAYSTGRGPIVCRGKAKIIEDKKGRFQIIISEIPYQVNKSSLLEKIALLVKEKKLPEIKDARDESDKEGIRIVIDLKSDASPQKILNRLYKLTELQTTFYLNMIALAGGIQPETLSLKSILEYYIQHRQEVVTRRSQFELKKAKGREHILEGLKKALDYIDEVIKTIKKSATKEEAHRNLVKKFDLSDLQTEAILAMKLQSLAGLERKKIEDELEEKKKIIAYLEDLLSHPGKILKVIKDELKEIKEKYSDPRRTKVYASPVGQLKEEDLIPDEECIITLTFGGYIKRMNPKIYQQQKRGGQGVTGVTTREEDSVKIIRSVSTHDSLLFFTNFGRVFQCRAYEIPETSRISKGQAVVNFLQLASEEKVNAIVALDKSISGNKFLVMATKGGLIKRMAIDSFKNVRRSGLIALKLPKDDELSWVEMTSGENDIILTTAQGQSIRFSENDVRVMGRVAMGVRGINLKSNDYVVSMGVVLSREKKKYLLAITENGFGKLSELNLFKVQRRGGSGIKVAKITSKTGRLVIAQIIADRESDLIVVSSKGIIIRVPLKSVSILGRDTQGVKIMKLKPGDKVATVAEV